MHTTAKGAWSAHEHTLFMRRVKEIGVNNKWGTFSTKIPGRIGYSCSGYWRTLIKKKMVHDENYYYNANKKVWAFKWARAATHLKDKDNFMNVKRFSFTVLQDDSGVFEEDEKHAK